MTYPGSLGLASWDEDEVGGDEGDEEKQPGDITCSEHRGKLGLPPDVDACGKLVRPSSSILSVESSSSLLLSTFIPLSPGFCAASFSLTSAALLSVWPSLSFLPPPPPPWARLKRSAANSRARTAACDWLGDEGIGAFLLGGSRVSGDP